VSRRMGVRPRSFDHPLIRRMLVALTDVRPFFLSKPVVSANSTRLPGSRQLSGRSLIRT